MKKSTSILASTMVASALVMPGTVSDAQGGYSAKIIWHFLFLIMPVLVSIMSIWQFNGWSCPYVKSTFV